MRYLKQSFVVAHNNFRQWRKNPRIIITFILASILCFMLSEKAVRFSIGHNTSMQAVEPFIWSFGDSNSILLSSMLLILLFADMPFLSAGTPFYLVRTNRWVWLVGQIIYTIAATAIYLLFILLFTAIICAKQTYIANIWSPTAAILGYTDAGKRVAIPALVKTLEMSWPYPCMFSVFFLMLGYALVLVLIMLFFNLLKGQSAGVVSVFVFSVYGFLLRPDTIQALFKLPDEAYYKANVVIGWLSPLNHATYHMHNFGYDLLPRLWHSYLFFIILIVIGFIGALWAIRNYNFIFWGTEG